MARTKQYVESEVIEKAMQLFWSNGYESTSVRMLEKEMGINQFSMYSSFGSKQGVFIESLKMYKHKARVELLDKLKQANNGVEDIKQYFYDFLQFSKGDSTNYGCLLTNTANELGDTGEPLILSEIKSFANLVLMAFIDKLKMDTQKSNSVIEQEANFLLIALQGVSVASKMFPDTHLDDFITMTFKYI